MIYLDNNKINKTNYNKIYLADKIIHQNLIDNAIPSGNNILAFEFDNSDGYEQHFKINKNTYVAKTSPYSRKTEPLEDCYDMFYDRESHLTKVTSLPTILDRASLGNMFSYCEMLTYVNFSQNFIASSIDTMFQNCISLNSVDLSMIDVSIITDVNGTFKGCVNLTKLNLNGWDLSSLKRYKDVFISCNNLKEIKMVGCSKESVDKIKDMLKQDNIKNVTIITE